MSEQSACCQDWACVRLMLAGGSKVASVEVCVVWPLPITSLAVEKQNVCCVSRSAWINEAVCVRAAQLGRLPRIINGTTDFGTEFGGRHRRPRDLSVFVFFSLQNPGGIPVIEVLERTHGSDTFNQEFEVKVNVRGSSIDCNYLSPWGLIAL